MKKKSIASRFLPYKSRLTSIARMLRKNMTKSEILLWQELKNKQVLGYDFHRQRPIDEFIVDFFCPQLSLVVEIDGDSHEGEHDRDNRRQHEIERYGVHFLRFDDEEVKNNLDGVLEAIREWIEQRGRSPAHDPNAPSRAKALCDVRGEQRGVISTKGER